LTRYLSERHQEWLAEQGADERERKKEAAYARLRAAGVPESAALTEYLEQARKRFKWECGNRDLKDLLIWVLAIAAVWLLGIQALIALVAFGLGRISAR
jgi:hypothetical protein